MESFKEFINPGAFLNTAYVGIDNQYFGVGKSLNLPVPTLDIPTRIIDGYIERIFYTKNPITVIIKKTNGKPEIWKATYKQWEHLRRIGQEPKEGIRVTLEMFLDGTVKSIKLTDQ